MKDFDYKQLDELIHSRLRLAILAVLMAVEEAEFTFLRDKIGASDGNLSVQLRKLEEAGYVKLHKEIVNRKPRTMCSISSQGRRQFEEYIKQMQNFFPKD